MYQMNPAPAPQTRGCVGGALAFCGKAALIVLVGNATLAVAFGLIVFLLTLFGHSIGHTFDGIVADLEAGGFALTALLALL